ncbi:MAG: hypothetical protein WC291_00175 [Thermodesulfovibrionales bacterium]|jgi:hypothetical protein
MREETVDLIAKCTLAAAAFIGGIVVLATVLIVGLELWPGAYPVAVKIIMVTVGAVVFSVLVAMGLMVIND